MSFCAREASIYLFVSTCIYFASEGTVDWIHTTTFIIILINDENEAFLSFKKIKIEFNYESISILNITIQTLAIKKWKNGKLSQIFDEEK